MYLTNINLLLLAICNHSLLQSKKCADISHFYCMHFSEKLGKFGLILMSYKMHTLELNVDWLHTFRSRYSHITVKVLIWSHSEFHFSFKALYGHKFICSLKFSPFLVWETLNITLGLTILKVFYASVSLFWPLNLLICPIIWKLKIWYRVVMEMMCNV